MAFKLPTMTRETSSSTGTGDMVMAGAQSGYFAASAGLSNADTTFLTFKMGADTEEGLYTYNSGPNSFTRTTIYRSTNANAAVNWAAGTKDVICGLPGPSNVDATGLGLLRASLGATTVGDAIFIAANAAAARTAAGAAASATTISAAGLATGGGDLSANRTITVTAAAQSDQETATSTTTVVTPAVQQFHPSANKAWAFFAVSGGATNLLASYNVSSVTYVGAGQYSANFTNAFSGVNNYGGVCTAQNTTGNPYADEDAGRTASAFKVVVINRGSGSTMDPPGVTVICVGDL